MGQNVHIAHQLGIGLLDLLSRDQGIALSHETMALPLWSSSRCKVDYMTTATRTTKARKTFRKRLQNNNLYIWQKS